MVGIEASICFKCWNNSCALSHGHVGSLSFNLQTRIDQEWHMVSQATASCSTLIGPELELLAAGSRDERLKDPGLDWKPR